MFILKINGEPVKGNAVVSLACGSPMSLSASTDGLSIGCTDSRSYDEWYAEFIHSKQQAMLNGGIGDSYTFTKSFSSGCVRTINGTIPDTLGNITLLGSEIVDVSVPENYDNVLLVSRLVVGGNKLDILRELYLFTMRLYAAFNHCTARLLEFSPDTWGSDDADSDNRLGKIRGALLNYQANVARWNYLVWKNSYKQDIEVSRHNTAISLGYSCVSCQVMGVTITTTIKKINAQPTDIDGLDSAYCLTIYRQSASDDRQKKDIGIVTEIYKDDTEIFGFGQDMSYKNWDKITIVQKLPAMVQSDKYSELFALAPGMGITQYIYLDKESDPTHRKNEFEVHTTWVVSMPDGSVKHLERAEQVFVAAMNAKSLTDSGVGQLK